MPGRVSVSILAIIVPHVTCVQPHGPIYSLLSDYFTIAFINTTIIKLLFLRRRTRSLKLNGRQLWLVGTVGQGRRCRLGRRADVLREYYVTSDSATELRMSHCERAQDVAFRRSIRAWSSASSFGLTFDAE